MFISDQGCLLRKSSSGENHLLLVFFLLETGLKSALSRISRSSAKASPQPDLFHSGSVLIEQRENGRPAFLKDFQPERLHRGIGGAYRALACASALTRFYEGNLLHLESFRDAWSILHHALGAFSEKPLPEATLLKALFLFARSEGYPVTAQWLNSKRASQRNCVVSILRQPPGRVDASPGELDFWIQDLERYFHDHTDLKPSGWKQ
ncbi:MAG: hypothetical protein R6V45_01165 [Oceanipulchritudo sp.]